MKCFYKGKNLYLALICNYSINFHGLEEKTPLGLNIVNKEQKGFPKQTIYTVITKDELPLKSYSDPYFSDGCGVEFVIPLAYLVKNLPEKVPTLDIQQMDDSLEDFFADCRDDLKAGLNGYGERYDEDEYEDFYGDIDESEGQN